MRWLLITLLVLSMALIPATATTANAACTVRADWMNRHTVARGETLYRIAIRYGSTVSELTAGNCLADPSRIFAGQVLRVPGGSNSGWSLLPGNPVPLLAAPVSNAPLIATLTNENVLMQGRTMDSAFLKVQTNTGLSGWMYRNDVPAHESFVSRLPVIENSGAGVPAQVPGTYVRLRSGPGYEYAILGYIHNQQVLVIGKSYNGQWVKVIVNGSSGWVFRQLVNLSGADFANLPEMY